jgi:hypothetical protein
MHQHIHHGYVEAVVDRRTPSAARLRDLSELRERRRARRKG